jgi:hypothetical protein
MSFESNEERIERLEAITVQTARMSIAMAEQIKGLLMIDCILLEQVLAANDATLVMLRMMMASGAVKESVRQPLLDAIASAETRRDFVSAQINDVKTKIGRLPSFQNPPPAEP